jgi:hypothetical protein
MAGRLELERIEVTGGGDRSPALAVVVAAGPP